MDLSKSLIENKKNISMVMAHILPLYVDKNLSDISFL